MRSAASGGFIELNKEIETCSVANAIAAENRHKHGRIKDEALPAVAWEPRPRQRVFILV
jgi:stalled ribosome alternative rescue factor ArfA